MLEQIRQTGQNKIFKLLLVMLALSFAIFGVGDIFKSSGNYVAKVGKEVITLNEFNQNLRNLIGSYKKNGINLSIDDIKKLQIDKFLVKDLVTNKLVEQEAEKLGLLFADELIINKIKLNPIFKNPQTKKFDRKILDQYLINLSMNEQQFINDYKKEFAVQYLKNGLFEQPVSLHLLAKNIAPYKLEKRVVDLIKFEDKDIFKDLTITDEELHDYYNKHKNQFLTPEYRYISYLSMDYNQIKDKLILTEAEIKKEYLDNIYDYNVPELRDFYNLIFISREEAENARAELVNSKDFVKKAKEISQVTDQELIYKNVDKISLPEDIKNEIFNLKINEISHPLKTDIGWHLVKLTKISPASSKAFNDIKNQVAENLKKKKTDQSLHENSQKIEDDLASGMSLDEVAAKYGLELKKVDRLSENEKNSMLPNYDNFKEVALSTEENSESPLTFTPEQNSFFIIRMDKIEPPVTKEFTEVKFNISKLIQDEKRSEILRKLEDEIIKKYKNGANGKVIAHQFGFSLQESILISRANGANNQETPVPLVNDIFSKSVGEISNLYKSNNNDYFIAIIKNIIKPKDLNIEEVNLTEQELKKDYLESIEQQYIQHLYNNNSVKYNDEILNNL